MKLEGVNFGIILISPNNDVQHTPIQGMKLEGVNFGIILMGPTNDV